MIKKKLCLLMSVALVAVAFSGCGAKKKTEGELNVFNWTEYMPPSVIKAFEKKYNIKVNYSTYSSNEEMLSKVKSAKKGMYDVAIPSDYMVDTMRKAGLLEKLDKSKVSNLKNIDPQYLNCYYDEGNKYSVPYMISNAILAYNKKKIPGGINSINQLFDSKYEKSMVSLDDERMLIGLTAISLGYTPNETDPAKLAKVKAKLAQLKPNIKLFDSDSPKTSMINKETSIGYMWCAEAELAMEENKDVVAVYPKEGFCRQEDNLVILAGAKNKVNAEKFLNFILQPKISKMISDVYPYVNPNKAAYPLLSDKYKKSPASNPSEADIAKGQLVKNLGDKAKLYDDIWTEFKNK